MILAAGLTPAWQQILLFDQFRHGQVNRASEVHWCASGKVLNVGRAAHALGAACKTISLIGGPVGEQIRREFAGENIAARWIESATPTRVCTTLVDRHSPVTTELVENSRTPSAAEIDEFVAAYGEEVRPADVAVLSGSLPEGVPAELYRDLLASTRCRAILDVRGPELLAALTARPFLVKPNREELGRTLGRELQTDSDVAAAIRQVIDLGAQWVVVTDGARPTCIGSAGGIQRAAPIAMDVVNPIGCGDCLAAGIAAAMDEGRSTLDAIRFGLAAAADNVQQLLAARLERGRVEAMAGQVVLEFIGAST